MSFLSPSRSLGFFFTVRHEYEVHSNFCSITATLVRLVRVRIEVRVRSVLLNFCVCIGSSCKGAYTGTSA